MECVGIYGQWPTRREWLGLVVGLIGVGILVREGDFQSSAVGLVFAVAAPLLWSIGSVWGIRKQMPSGLMSPAIQFLSSGLTMLIIGLAMGERLTTVPELGATLSLAYLVVFGSVVAYTAYVYLLKTVRPALATSYAYVNPVVAVALGVTLGAEVLTGPLFFALPLILIAVAMVRQGPSASRPQPVRSEKGGALAA